MTIREIKIASACRTQRFFPALKPGVGLLARRMSLVWGVRSITHEPHDIADVTANASRIALDEDLRTIWAMPPLAGGEREEHKDV